MKITRIRIFKTDLPYVGSAYVWGSGNAIEVAKASVVVIDTDAGLQGCGEFTPCGENYMVAHSEGVEALARLVAPKLLGEDPRQVARIEQLMDHTVQGHGYAKAPFDAASTPTECLQNTTDLMNYNTRSTGTGGAWAKGGDLYAPDEPGLGVTADFDSLGAPVSEYRI